MGVPGDVGQLRRLGPGSLILDLLPVESEANFPNIFVLVRRGLP